MIWFFLFQFLGLVFVGSCWYLYGKYCTKKHKEDSVLDVLLDNIKKIIITVLISTVVLTVVMSGPLYRTGQCYSKGISMNANTKYSWWLGECLMQTKNNSWIPLKLTRGVPDGSDDTGAYN